MLLKRLDDYLTEQNRYVGWIHESIEFLNLVYRKRKFTKIDELTYKVERKTLLNLFDKIKELYTDYNDVLSKYPDELGHETIQEASAVLKFAPSLLKNDETLSCQIVSDAPKLCAASKSYVMEVQRVEIVPPTYVNRAICKVEKLFCVFKEKHKNVLKMYSENVLTISYGKVNESAVQLVSKSCCLAKVVVRTKNCCFSKTTNVADVHEQFQLTTEDTVVENELNKFFKVDVSFLYLKCYDRVSLRMFWFYFSFADFNLFEFSVFMLTSFLFVLFLFVGKVSLFVVKIGILTVGSVNAVWALILCLLFCVIV